MEHQKQGIRECEKSVQNNTIVVPKGNGASGITDEKSASKQAKPLQNSDAKRANDFLLKQ